MLQTRYDGKLRPPRDCHRLPQPCRESLPPSESPFSYSSRSGLINIEIVARHHVSDVTKPGFRSPPHDTHRSALDRSPDSRDGKQSAALVSPASQSRLVLSTTYDRPVGTVSTPGRPGRTRHLFIPRGLVRRSHGSGRQSRRLGWHRLKSRWYGLESQTDTRKHAATSRGVQQTP